MSLLSPYREKASAKQLKKWYNTGIALGGNYDCSEDCFASMTGNTEEIADIVADKFRDLGVEVDVG